MKHDISLLISIMILLVTISSCSPNQESNIPITPKISYTSTGVNVHQVSPVQVATQVINASDKDREKDSADTIFLMEFRTIISMYLIDNPRPLNLLGVNE